MFARIKSGLEIENVWEKLSKEWKMPMKPELLILIKGGVNLSTSNPRLEGIVRRNLFRTARTLSINTWVVTDGVASPLVNVVGKAVGEGVVSALSSKSVALGIAPVSRVANAHLLEPRKNSEVCHYNVEQARAVSERSGCLPLNHHHTHFLLAEYENEESTTAQKFRQEFEIYLTKANEHDYPLSLMVVVGGDSSTLEEVVDCVKDSRPVLVLSGTGGIADLLKEALKTAPTPATWSTINAAYAEELARQAYLMSRSPSDSGNPLTVLDIDDLLRQCQHHNNLIYFFDVEELEPGQDVDKLFCFTLLRSAFSSRLMIQQLTMAIQWDCVDFVKHFLSTSSDNVESWQLQEIEKNCVMTALVQDKVNFVQLFAAIHLDLQRFFSLDNLFHLYSKSLKRDSVGQKLYRHHIKLNQNMESSCQMSPFYRSVDSLLERLLDDSRFHFHTGCFDAIASHEGCVTAQCIQEMKRDGFCSVAERGLFLWALLFRRHRLAFLFWRLGQDHLGGAVCASQLLRSLSVMAENQNFVDLATELQEWADLWESRAVDLLSVFYSRDMTTTRQLLHRPLPYWGSPFLDQNLRRGVFAPTLNRPTLLNLIFRFSMLDLAAHSAAQTTIADLWYGRLPVGMARRKVFFHIFFPFGRERREFPQPEQGCTFIRDLYDFYSAPVTKFFSNALSYAVFLAVLSVYVLCDMKGGLQSTTALEVLLHVWMWALIVEDVGQIFTHNQPFLRRRLWTWLQSQWKFDLAMYLMYLLALVLRMALTDEWHFKWARASFAITTVLAFQSCMQFFLVWETMGPTVSMIEKMWKDIFRLLLLCFVILLAFGVAFTALLHPGSNSEALVTYSHTLKHAYFQAHGHLFLDEFLRVLKTNVSGVGDCEMNFTMGERNPNVHCPNGHVLLPILLVIYLALANIMIMTLIIGQMTSTFDAIHKKLRRVWLHQLLTLTQEYCLRPTLAPPLSLLNYALRIVRYVFLSKDRNADPTQTVQNAQRLVWFEKSSAEKYFSLYKETMVADGGMTGSATTEK